MRIEANVDGFDRSACLLDPRRHSLRPTSADILATPASGGLGPGVVDMSLRRAYMPREGRECPFCPSYRGSRVCEGTVVRSVEEFWRKPERLAVPSDSEIQRRRISPLKC